jgi:hypothetical protein
MYLDKVSEAIAHFIGLFQIETEQARLRDDYLEFKALQAAQQADQPEDHAPLAFQSPYDFDDPDPGLHYVPVGPDLETLTSPTDVTYTPLGFPINGGFYPVTYPGYAPLIYPPYHSGMPVFELQPPGSVAVHIAQINNLSDNDFVNVGAVPVEFHSIGMPNLALEALLHEAALSLPVPPASFGSEADIGSFISDTAAALNVLPAEIASAAQGAGPADAPLAAPLAADGISTETIVSLIDNPLADATYVDGLPATEAPKLDDMLPEASPLVKQASETAPDPAPGGNHSINGSGSTAIGETVLGQGSYAGDTAVHVNTGSNALVNSATVINDALAGAVFAAAGSHYSLDAIIQTNAWSDSDAIGASLNGWGSVQQAATAAFNIAGMSRIDSAGDTGSAGHAYTGFPKAWAVTEIKGNFVSLNWVQQTNFVIDNDTVVVSSSHGVTTEVGTGGNQAINDLSIADLGKYYDLILIGGNYYDANIITQTNVLLDNDVVGSLAGFQTSGHGSVSTGGNLLWNDAGIVSVGHGGTDALPDGFTKALHDFAGGDHSLPSDVLNDDAFQGLAGLKVLYISGSVYDLQYIQQTNVLGDADQVVLAMNAAHPNIGGDWSITTGSNALVNSARIVDVDPAAKTYAGGGHYSDELLVQTDIIRTDHLMEQANGDHLVNEAVAFLSDDMAAPHAEDPISHLKHPVDIHPGYSDIMQSVTS